MELDQYIDVFLDESREHLQSVNDHILELEKHPEDLTIVNEIFRSAHTLKGMAATMGFEDIAALTHHMENVLDQIRHEALTVTTEVIDVTFSAIEALEEMVADVAEGKDGKKDVRELVSRLERINSGEAIAATTAENQAESEQFQLDEYQLTVINQAVEQDFQAYQIRVLLTSDCILKAARAYMVLEALEGLGEMIQTNPSVEALEEGEFEQGFDLLLLTNESKQEVEKAVHRISEVEEVQVTDFIYVDQSGLTQETDPTANAQPIEKSDTSEAEHKEKNAPTAATRNTSKTIRVNLDRIDHLMNLFEEVVIDRSRLENLAQQSRDMKILETVENMARVTSDMQNLILSMRMVPVEQVFNRFPRMVRGLAKDLDKKIELTIEGATTELDRTVVDEIGDPLVHLIRNSMDHGIEAPSVRKTLGKPETGNLSLRAYHSGNHVFIEIEDDGAGINREKVLAKAIENGIVAQTDAELLSDDEVNELILSSGFSTADQVSDLSGRGVGLDVVKNKIESLGGRITIESTKGKGSKFSIELPLTLSILSSLLVKVADEIYAVPLTSIIETALLQESEILSAHGQKVMDFRGRVIPLVSLEEVFDIPRLEAMKRKDYAVVIVKKGDKLTGLIVDSFIGQQEVVLKSLGNYLRDVFAISGATILGDGAVSLIIDPNALIA